MNDSALKYVNEEDPIVSSWLTYDDTVALIKRTRKKTFFMYVQHHARKIVQPVPDAEFPLTTEVSGNVVVTKDALLRGLESTYMKYIRNDVLIHVGECSTCFFVGGSY